MSTSTSQDTWTFEESLTAIDDPVPSSSDSGIFDACKVTPHALERDVQRILLGLPDVQFSSLRVHRLPDGICLTGVVTVPPGSKPMFDRLVTKATGVNRVLNHLVVQPSECTASR